LRLLLRPDLIKGEGRSGLRLFGDQPIPLVISLFPLICGFLELDRIVPFNCKGFPQGFDSILQNLQGTTGDFPF